MTIRDEDHRSPRRRARDEQIASEPHKAPLTLPQDARPAPMEALLRRRPVAVEGVVENGLVRPLGSAVRLPEHARVIIVAAEQK
jgi:hypothetical protein